ncbi:MAG TPA: type 1 glutamine amidotransferase [Thermoleophilaceae bacterium]|nr:type 1 glutamine amidotransferase [Thermoleophilaceae bacterium]
MRVLTIVHQANAGAGVFGEVAEAAGHELERWVPSAGPPPSEDGFGAVMVFGGSMHLDQEDANPWLRDEKAFLRELLDSDTPALGVCLGSQLLAEAAGAAPRRASRPEIGWHGIELTPEGESDPLLAPLAGGFEGFGWHSYEFPLPPEADPLARSEVCLQAFRLRDRPVWGLQFHAEVTPGILDSWIDDYDSDEDAVRIGVDPARLREESAGRIEAWNELGRGISDRFLREATPG